MATAGRILIMPKGTWNAETTYENLDMVAHSGRAWVAKKVSVGIEPSEENAEYWHDFLGMNMVTIEEMEEKIAEITESLEYTSEEATYENGITGALYSFKNSVIKKVIGTISITPTEANSRLKVASITEKYYPGYIIPFVAYDFARGDFSHGYVDTDGSVYLQILENTVNLANSYRIVCIY